MSNPILILSDLALVAVLGAWYATFAPAPAAASQADAAHPVVLELFQSQGRSSCQPALAVLNQIANRPDVLALNFAVTYWDQPR